MDPQDAISKYPQIEPADEMGTFGMGPGSPDDGPIDPEEIHYLAATFEAAQNG